MPAWVEGSVRGAAAPRNWTRASELAEEDEVLRLEEAFEEQEQQRAGRHQNERRHRRDLELVPLAGRVHVDRERRDEGRAEQERARELVQRIQEDEDRAGAHARSSQRQR